MSRNPEILTLI